MSPEVSSVPSFNNLLEDKSGQFTHPTIVFSQVVGMDSLNNCQVSLEKEGHPPFHRFEYLPETLLCKPSSSFSGSIAVSPLTGRLFFKDVLFISSDFRLDVVDGFISFKWFLYDSERCGRLVHTLKTRDHCIILDTPHINAITMSISLLEEGACGCELPVYQIILHNTCPVFGFATTSFRLAFGPCLGGGSGKSRL